MMVDSGSSSGCSFRAMDVQNMACALALMTAVACTSRTDPTEPTPSTETPAASEAAPSTETAATSETPTPSSRPSGPRASTGNGQVGVGDFLNVRFGAPVPETLKAAGPNTPPIGQSDLIVYQPITAPTPDFGTAGVAVVENSEEAAKAGLHYDTTGVVWGAYFESPQDGCDPELFTKWVDRAREGRKELSFDRKEAPVGNGKRILGRLVTPRALWNFDCDDESFSIAVRDTSVLAASGDEATRAFFDTNYESFLKSLGIDAASK